MHDTEKVDEPSEALDSSDNSPEKTESTDNYKKPHSSINSRFSLVKVFSLVILVAGLVISVLLNISFLSLDEAATTDSSVFLWVLVTGAFLITAVSLGISFWLYYVRSLYLKDGPALVPEKWGKVISELSQITNQSNINTFKALTSLIEANSIQISKSETLLESFLTLQETISNRDEEIARLKKGHDSKVFKRFINRFIKVSISLEEIYQEERDSDQAKNFKYLCRKMQNALEECGVEQIYPSVGYDYREMGPEVLDNPNVIETNDKSKNFQIASVQSPAYVIEGEGDREIILPSKVTIYMNNEERGAGK